MSRSIDGYFGKVRLHKQALGGMCQDYIMTFHQDVSTIDEVIARGFDLFKELMEDDATDVKARLIARVRYSRMNDRHEVVGHEVYHFTSHQAEYIGDVHDFYTRHMMRIASRINCFHQNGSRLVIDRIERLHICLTRCRAP